MYLCAFVFNKHVKAESPEIIDSGPDCQFTILYLDK